MVRGGRSAPRSLLLFWLALTCGCDETDLFNPGARCETAVFPPSRRGVDVLLVIDRSESMADDWSGLVSAVSGVASDLDADERLGLVLFPPPFQESCVRGELAADPETSSADDVRAAIRAERARPTAGPTPAGETFRWLSSYAAQRTSERRLAAVLISDGADVCTSSDDVIDAVGRLWQEHGAATHVIPIEVVGPRGSTWLDDAAVAGGTTEPDALGGYRSRIEAAADDTACRFPFRFAIDPRSASSFSVRVGDERLEAGADGFLLDGNAGVVLDGAACALARESDEDVVVRACCNAFESCGAAAATDGGPTRAGD